MAKLLTSILPDATRMLQGRYKLATMFQRNGYSMERTFLYAMLCFSKWLGTELFPAGIHAWPPKEKSSLPSASSSLT